MEASWNNEISVVRNILWDIQCLRVLSSLQSAMISILNVIKNFGMNMILILLTGRVKCIYTRKTKTREHFHFEVFFILQTKDMESKSTLDVISTYHLQYA